MRPAGAGSSADDHRRGRLEARVVAAVELDRLEPERVQCVAVRRIARPGYGDAVAAG